MKLDFVGIIDKGKQGMVSGADVGDAYNWTTMQT